MTVYVLVKGWQYEGELIIGVYNTRELAETERDLQDSRYVDYLKIYEHDVKCS